MHELFDPSIAPSSNEEIIKTASSYTYIHLILVDIHGIPRVKIYPSDAMESLLSNGGNIEIEAMTFATDGSVVKIEDHARISYGNIRIRPIATTMRNWRWLGLQTQSKIMQFFVTPEWLYGGTISADPREMALAQLKRLHDQGLDLFMSTEVQFRLFKLQDSPEGEPEPAHSITNMFNVSLAQEYEKVYVEIDKRIRALGFKFESFHNEHGSGQFEAPMSADWGIKAADDVVRFKMIVRQVAHECGYRASFMTKVNPGQPSTSFHFNHSVWQRKDGKLSKENEMLDGNDVRKISSFTKHWVAGLLHHAAGLQAIWSPTVNCYRRLHKAWAPNYADWGIENRLTSFRVKNGGTPTTTFVENRCPSSASNPYLVMAGVIAAGLDGVKRTLPLIDDGAKTLGQLPHNLPKAIEELKKDDIICTALGKEFIDWYGAVKLDEMKRLETVDVALERKEDFVKERKAYFDSV